MDVAKLKNAVAIADAGRSGEVRCLGEIENTFEATRRLVAKLSAKYARLSFCYEADPTGYGLYRWIRDLGHDCMVVAPSLIPSKPGDRVEHKSARCHQPGQIAASRRTHRSLGTG